MAQKKGRMVLLVQHKKKDKGEELDGAEFVAEVESADAAWNLVREDTTEHYSLSDAVGNHEDWGSTYFVAEVIEAFKPVPFMEANARREEVEL